MTTEALLLVFDLALRGGVCLVLGLLGGLLLRDQPRRIEAWIAAMFAAGVGGFAVWSGPDLGLRREPWMAVPMILAAGNGLVFWLLSQAVFGERFRLRIWHVLAWLGLAGLSFALQHNRRLGSEETVLALSHLMAFQTVVFATLAVAFALQTWSGDLVVERRRLRVVVVPAAMAHVSLNVMAEAIQGLGARGLGASLVAAVVLTLLSFMAAWWTLSVTGTETIFAWPSGEVADLETLSVEERDLIRGLMDEVARERLYRRQDLTLAELAALYDMTPSQLRDVMHHGLGRRSFRDFLESFRLQEAKVALADPDQDETAISLIARDAGFSSLGRFSRAFRAQTGVTPQAFRQARPAPDVV